MDSLEAQKRFFTEYCKQNNYSLVKIYADEGKSGTKMKNRTQLLQLLSDANRGMFDAVLIKDVSRLARNTVDFLTSIRKLKTLDVKVIFVNYDQTSSDSSEFMLTMLSAIAQEESANTSKRVKFGKKMNAEKGRVPNIIYGYDKIIGDYFNLNINQAEAAVVYRIFDMYTNQDIGTNKISMILNNENLKTKRNFNWGQGAISRILANDFYIGNVTNGKEEVEDFLTGKRKVADSSEWIVIYKPELQIIDNETFKKAQEILATRQKIFNLTGERSSEKHIFSKLIKCACCDASFRRSVRIYKNTYIKWICTGRNANGVDACPNKTVIDEEEMLTAIRDYLTKILKDKQGVIERIVKEFKRQYKTKDQNEVSEKDLTAQLNNTKKIKQKYLEMYEAEVITIEELREKTKQLNNTIDSLLEEIKMVNLNINKSDLLQNILNETFKDIGNVLAITNVTNELLNRIIEKIMVDENGKVDVYLKLFSDIGLDKTVLVADNYTYGYD